MIEIRLLKLSMTRAFFSASIEVIIFLNIINSLVSTLEKAQICWLKTSRVLSFIMRQS